jgi:uncharacterized protein with PQ loop repeat
MSTLPVLAGIASTIVFAVSTLPMLLKAHRTRDLSSYSLGNIILANVGNTIHSVYVFSLPAGPIWFLHSFYVASSALMLVWFLRYNLRTRALAGLVLDRLR